jgi:hypothetical protein
MAFLDQAFDVNELPQSESNFDPLPAGWYQAKINGAEIKTTKNGTGQYIAVRYDITGPSHQGRVVYGNLNIKNANPKAEEIGRSQLAELMRSIGLARVTDSDQLIGGDLQIKLAVKKDEEYGDKNEIKGFKAINGSQPPMPASAPIQSAPAQPPAASAPPWAKK